MLLWRSIGIGDESDVLLIGDESDVRQAPV